VDSDERLSLAIQNGPGEFAGSASRQAIASHGIATFPGLILSAPGSYSISATAGSLTGELAAVTVSGTSGTPPAGFVGTLYQYVLNRNADPGGLAYWTQLLANGATRLQIAQGFWESAEHRGIQVDLNYTTFLHRTSEAQGREFWITQFQAGLDERRITEAFTQSSEYRRDRSSPGAYVTGLYTDGLGRTPDAAGLEYWTAVATEVGASAAAQRILSGAERTLLVLDRYYADLLLRAPDPVGEAQWSRQMLAGAVSHSEVAEAFLASDEFFQRANSGN
jgi:hypothetical protein